MSASKRNLIVLILAVVCHVSAGSVVAQQARFSDEELRRRVLDSIASAQRFLLQSQQSGGTWPHEQFASDPEGVNGLVTLALLNSGVPADDPAMVKALDHLEHPNTRPQRTYEIALVIMALAAGDRGHGKIPLLARKLESGQNGGPDGGNWGYQAGSRNWDNSNTQFAILGLREAAHAGYRVDEDVWRRAQQHFLRTRQGSLQGMSGVGWAYKGEGTPYGSMSVAGLASLILTQEMLADDSDVTPTGEILCCAQAEDEVQQTIDAGIHWLNKNIQIESNPGTRRDWLFYYLYGLERAGRFSGRRFFGNRDWYREGAEFLVTRQDIRQGFWNRQVEPSQIVGTSLALLFLSKGLSPVLINKLKYGPRDVRSGEVLQNEWNKHPRDIKNLTEFISKQQLWPKLLSWQVVDLRTAANGEGVAALLQSPVQFISGSQSPDAIQGRELDLLRSYLTQGGFLFAVNNCDSAEFDAGFRNLVNKLFDGQYRLTKLPPTHDVYRSEFLFTEEGGQPELWGVEFGCRTAIIYSPFDHACRWNKWSVNDPTDRLPQVKTQIGKSMQLGTNVVAYATGRELLDKLERPQVLTTAAENQMNRGRLTIARLRHFGGWDTAPNALGRLQAALETVGIEAARQTPNLPANDPALFDYPLIYMHGRRNFQLSDEELAGLATHLENGGFLFADACCGSQQFDDSFRAMVDQLFGQPLEPIPATHEIYRMQLGYDIRRVKRRIPSQRDNASSLEVQESIGEPILEGVKIQGKYAVVYSKYDLSCALERQATTACAGYTTEDAVRIGVNLVLYGLLR